MSATKRLPSPREAAIASAERWIASGRIPGWAQEGLRNIAASTGNVAEVARCALSFDPPEYDPEQDPDVPRLEPAGSTSSADAQVARMLGLPAGAIDAERKRGRGSHGTPRTAAPRRPVAGSSGSSRGKGAFRS